MYVYELWDDFYDSETVFCSTFEEAKAQAIAYVKEWAKEEEISTEELEESLAEVRGWCENNAITHWNDDPKWEFGDVAIIHKREVL